MTIIIDDQLEFHSHLHIILKSVLDEIRELNWACNELSIVFNPHPIPNSTHADFKLQEANLDSLKSCNLSGFEFYEVLRTRENQYIWGVFSGFRGPIPEILFDKRPYADGNEDTWENPERFQIENAEMEIICFDSSCTILKFKNELLAQRILTQFPGSRILKPADPA